MLKPEGVENKSMTRRGTVWEAVCRIAKKGKRKAKTNARRDFDEPCGLNRADCPGCNNHSTHCP